MECEEFEQSIFARRQMDGLASAADGAGGSVDFQVVAAQDRVFLLVSAANEGADAGDQLGELERLGQVVIRAGIEAGNLVLVWCLGRQHRGHGS